MFFRDCGLPYGLYGSLCTLRVTVTGFHATRGMGEWLALTQQGLSPRKKRQALLGAPTAGVIRMYLKGARRMRIVGGDTVAGDAFGVRASGLADCQYGKHFPSPEVQARCVIWLPGGNLIWEGAARQARIGSCSSQPKNPRPNQVQ
jgi:hypothetical protein